jgi:hypothetical protein
LFSTSCTLDTYLHLHGRIRMRIREAKKINWPYRSGCGTLAGKIQQYCEVFEGCQERGGGAGAGVGQGRGRERQHV